MSADWLATVPTKFVVVAGTVGFVVALFALVAVFDPRTRRHLRFVARQTGMGRGIGLAATLAAAVAFGSVFVLGGTTTGRSDYLLVFALLVHVAGLYLLGVAAGTLPKYLATRSAPGVDAADAEPGARVAVDGEVVASAEPLETPFAGESAVCYEIRVMERRGESDRATNAESIGIGGNWHLEHLDEAGVAFHLNDGTGRVAVAPDGGTLDLEEATEVAVTVEEDLPDRVREFVTDNLAEVGFGAHDRRYVEAALRPGDRVTVVGPVVEGDGGDDPPVVDGRRGDCIVASQGIEGYRSTLRRRVTGAGVGGVSMAAAGYAAMLVVSGAA